MTTLTPGSSNLQNTITPLPNPPLSLTSTSQNINLALINAHYVTINFQTFTHLFPSSTLGFEDVNLLLQTISETNRMQDQLSSLFQHTDLSSNTYQPSNILDATTSSIQNVFMQLISSISNPFINFLVTTAFVLSLIWSIVLTMWTLHMCASFFIQKVKNRTHPPNNSVPEV